MTIHKLRTKYIQVGMVVASIFVFVLIHASFRLTESPPVWYDEGFYMQAARLIVESGGDIGIMLSPEVNVGGEAITVGFPLIYPLGAALHLFGHSIHVARVVMVVFLLLFTGALWCYARRAFGVVVAVGVCVLIATLPTLYGNGKSVLGEVPGLFFLLLFMSSLYAYASRPRMGVLIAGGIALGLGAATKPVFLLALLALIPVLVLKRKQLHLNPTMLTIGTLATLVPLVVWAATQFGSNTSLTALISFYANPYEAGGVATLMSHNAFRFLREAVPLYLGAMMVLWVAALVLRHHRGVAVLPSEMFAFLFAILVLVFYMRTPGWYRYFFPALVLAIIFLPNNLMVLARAVFKRTRWQQIVVTTCVILLASVHLYQLYFDSWVAGYYQSRDTAQLETFFREWSTSHRGPLLLYNIPEIAIFLDPQLQYYQYLRPHENQVLGVENLSLLGQGYFRSIIINTKTLANIEVLWQNMYPASTTIGHYTVLEK